MKYHQSMKVGPWDAAGQTESAGSFTVRLVVLDVSQESQKRPAHLASEPAVIGSHWAKRFPNWRTEAFTSPQCVFGKLWRQS